MKCSASTVGALWVGSAALVAGGMGAGALGLGEFRWAFDLGALGCAAWGLGASLGLSNASKGLAAWFDGRHSSQEMDLRSQPPAGRMAFIPAIQGFFGQLHSRLFGLIQGIHRFTFQFFRLDREIGVFLRAMSEMSEEVKEGIEGVGHIHTATDQQYAGSEEISATAQALSILAADLNGAVETVSEKAEVGQSRLTLMEAALKDIEQGMGEVRSHAGRLADRAANIGSVAQVITGISEQTNLLALNASIEAARAGEAGRGFAVVAEEVRKLAEESKRAAAQIGESLKELGDSVQETTREIGTMAQKVTASSEHTSQSLEGIAGVLMGIGAVRDASSRVAASAQELSASSQELAASAETVARGTEDLRGRFDRMGGLLKTFEDSSADLERNSQEGVAEASGLVQSLGGLKIITPKDFVTIAEGAIKAHQDWVKHLDGALKGERWDLETDPTRCRFGIFLSFVPRPDEVPEKLWQEGLALHDHLHALGHQAHDALSGDDLPRARRHHDEAMHVSQKLVAALNEMIALCRQGTSLEGTSLRALPPSR